MHVGCGSQRSPAAPPNNSFKPKPLRGSAELRRFDINVKIRRKVSELERLVNEAQRPKPN